MADQTTEVEPISPSLPPNYECRNQSVLSLIKGSGPSRCSLASCVFSSSMKECRRAARVQRKSLSFTTLPTTSESGWTWTYKYFSVSHVTNSAMKILTERPNHKKINSFWLKSSLGKKIKMDDDAADTSSSVSEVDKETLALTR